MSLIPTILLYDVYGTPMSERGILFVPARFDFVGDTDAHIECRLADAVDDFDAFETRFSPWDNGICRRATGWVRARIPRALQYTPLTPNLVDWFYSFEFPFLAVHRANSRTFLRATPFICVDDYDGPGLLFHHSEANETRKSQIGAAFWHALLREPNELSSFRVLVDDPDEGRFMVGYERNEFYVVPLWDEDAPGRLDQQLVHLPGQVTICPDCGGTGEESFFPAGWSCGSCAGSGMAS